MYEYAAPTLSASVLMKHFGDPELCKAQMDSNVRALTERRLASSMIDSDSASQKLERRGLALNIVGVFESSSP